MKHEHELKHFSEIKLTARFDILMLVFNLFGDKFWYGEKVHFFFSMVFLNWPAEMEFEVIQGIDISHSCTWVLSAINALEST